MGLLNYYASSPIIKMVSTFDMDTNTYHKSIAATASESKTIIQNHIKTRHCVFGYVIGLTMGILITTLIASSFVPFGKLGNVYQYD